MILGPIKAEQFTELEKHFEDNSIIHNVYKIMPKATTHDPTSNVGLESFFVEIHEVEDSPKDMISNICSEFKVPLDEELFSFSVNISEFLNEKINTAIINTGSANKYFHLFTSLDLCFIIITILVFNCD